MAMKDYEGKHIFVSLKTNEGKRRYSGKVLEVVYMGQEGSGFEFWMFTMKDKFNSLVSFSSNEIEFIEEEKEVVE